jgi:hypothetical protein
MKCKKKLAGGLGEEFAGFDRRKIADASPSIRVTCARGFGVRKSIIDAIDL